MQLFITALYSSSCPASVFQNSILSFASIFSRQYFSSFRLSYVWNESNLIKLVPIGGWIVSAAVAAGVTEAIGWTVAVDFAKIARKEWDRKRNAQEAAEAYAEAEYYKSKNSNSSDINEDAEDFGE